MPPRKRLPMKGDINETKIENRQLCAACGEVIYDNNWVILGSHKTIHHGGPYSDRCYRKINGFGGDSHGRQQDEDAAGDSEDG